LTHLGVEVHLLVTVAELNVFAGYEAPAFLLNLFEGSRVAVFRLVVIGLFVTFNSRLRTFTSLI
jgi:hypothetical protein